MSGPSELNLVSNAVLSFPSGTRFVLNQTQAPVRKFNGPISGPMWKTVSDLGSAYKDDFDWTTYDRIQERFVDAPPRGGVVFKTTFRLANYHTSCSKCHYALEIDSYGRGCIHNCVYCYAKDQLSKRAFWNNPMPFPVDLSEIRKIMYIVFETDGPSKWRNILEKRIPIRIGSMSDSFMWMDQKYGITKELIRIFNFYKYPHIVFTRSDLAAHDDYLKIYDRKLIAIQFSISGNNEKLTKLIEPGAPSVTRRLAALKKLNEHGIWSTVRINPFFPTYPDGYYTDHESIVRRFGSREQVPSFDLLTTEFFDQLKEAKVPSVLAGVVRLTTKSLGQMSATTGTNFKDFFKPEVMSTPGGKTYSDAEVAHYYFRFFKECRQRGIRFSTCYIGNGIKDYYQYQDLWSNKKDCCDVVGNVAGFKSSSQQITWQDRGKHATSKEEYKKGLLQEMKNPELSRNVPHTQAPANAELETRL